MDKAKEIAGAGAGAAAGDKAPIENPNSNSTLISAPSPDDGSALEVPSHIPSRTPFTSLSQIDSDLALARALQEQERAYMMLRMAGGEGSDYGSSVEGSYEEEEVEADGDSDEAYVAQGSVEGSDYGEDAFEANEGSINPEDFVDDEEYARALQDAEERDVAVRLMALTGLDDWGVEENGDANSHEQDAWREVDPDQLSYEELVALSEVVGTESRGLSVDTIASLPSICYKAPNRDDCNSDQCVICRLDFEDGDFLVVLSCKHKYHTECINKWLQINKICPVCSTEVSTTCSSHEAKVD